MIILTFKLSVKSDWHISASFGSRQIQADSVIERDARNSPFIRAASIKGLFREALQDMENFTALNPKPPHDLLGVDGIEGKWHFSDATLETDARSVVTMGVRVDPRWRRAEDGKFFTRELGSGNSAFTFTIEGSAMQEEIEWLVVLARYIRRFGNRRRRGAGLCEIELTDVSGAPSDYTQEAILNDFKTRQEGGKPQNVQSDEATKETPVDESNAKRYRLYLRTETPVVISATQEAGNNYTGEIFIPGRTVRGAIGALAYRRNTEPTSNFDHIFMLGGASFSMLYPIENTALIDTVPNGIFRDKEHGTLISQISGSDTKGHNKYRGYYHLGLLDAQEESYIPLQTKMHVSIDNRTKRSLTGELYSYEAIPTGTHYVGEITLSDVEWHTFAETTGIRLNKAFDIFIGKGRRRGYGRCKAIIQPVEDETTPPVWCPVKLSERLQLSGKDWLLMVFASDTILLDDWGRAVNFEDKKSGQAALKALLQLGSITIQHTNIQPKLIEGFDLRSGLPMWRDLGIAKGSVIAFEMANSNESIEDVFANLEQQGIGLRRSEGFGRVIFNHPLYFGEYGLLASDIDIPKQLTISSKEGVDHVTKWREFVSKKLLDSEFDRSEYRSLARYLVEYQFEDVEAIKNFLDKKLENLEPEDLLHYGLSEAFAAHRSKEPRIAPKVKRELLGLLKHLEDEEQYPKIFWQEGLVILAQLLNQSVKKEDKAKS